MLFTSTAFDYNLIIFISTFSDCVRAVVAYEQTAESQIEDRMKLWIRGACDRDGGRAARFLKSRKENQA